MENNAQPQQQQPPPPPPQLYSLLIHNHDLPNEAYIDITTGTSFPISITVSNGITLYFTVTNNSVTINNHGAQDNNNNNNGAPQLHQLHVHNGAEYYLHPLQLHDHALTLPNLPTLPAHVTITNNGDVTFDLLVAEDNTIYIIDPAPPPNNGNGDDNHQIMNQPITLPFKLTLLFNNANPNNTIIAISINITDHSIFISAYSKLGITDWAAILDFVPAAPQP